MHLGEDAYRAIGATVSVPACNSLPEVPVSVPLSKSILPKNDKGVQVVLGHKEAIGKEAERSHQIRRSTQDEAIRFIMIGLMHMASEINHIPG